METTNITEKITLDALTKDSVSVLRQTMVEINGKLVQAGENWRRAYMNTASGREAITAELAEPYLSSVMAVWGDAPTVEEQPPEIPA